MKEQSQQLSFDQLNHFFAQLNPLDVEQFYTAYSLWSTQQRIQTLQAQIDDIHRDIAENIERLEQVHPSALALATLARLQANGVSDIAILDRMLERGEEWLDRTMQRLDYCEKIDFITGGYTKWCEHALEGAYDWIDSMQEQEAANSSLVEPTFSEIRKHSGSIEQNETVENGEPANSLMEELLLQKLMSDDTEEAEKAEDTVNIQNAVNAVNEASMLDTTLKIRAISHPAPAETSSAGDNTQLVPSEHHALPTEQESQPEDVESTPILTETRIWQQESQPESVEATPVLAETHSERTEVTMMSVDESQAAPASGTSYSTDQMETPDWSAALEQGNTTQTGHRNVSVKRKKGFWRTLLAILFHI